jgi:hypothetical protein
MQYKLLWRKCYVIIPRSEIHEKYHLTVSFGETSNGEWNLRRAEDGPRTKNELPLLVTVLNYIWETSSWLVVTVRHGLFHLKDKETEERKPQCRRWSFKQKCFPAPLFTCCSSYISVLSSSEISLFSTVNKRLVAEQRASYLFGKSLSRPPGGAAAGTALESPPRGPVRADRGDKDKIKLLLSREFFYSKLLAAVSRI